MRVFAYRKTDDFEKVHLEKKELLRGIRDSGYAYDEMLATLNAQPDLNREVHEVVTLFMLKDAIIRLSDAAVAETQKKAAKGYKALYDIISQHADYQLGLSTTINNAIRSYGESLMKDEKYAQYKARVHEMNGSHKALGDPQEDETRG